MALYLKFLESLAAKSAQPVISDKRPLDTSSILPLPDHMDGTQPITKRGKLHHDTAENGKSSTALSTAEPGSFPLMSLPPELRNMIYQFMLTCPTPIQIIALRIKGSSRKIGFKKVKKQTRFFVPNEGGPSRLGLLTVSRQVHAEAVHWLYSENEFDLSTFQSLCVFLHQIGRANRQSLIQLIVRGDMDSRWGTDAFIILAEATHIRSLKFTTFHFYQYVKPGYVFSMMKPWIAAVCKGCTTFRAVITALKMIKWQQVVPGTVIHHPVGGHHQHVEFLGYFYDSLISEIFTAKQAFRIRREIDSLIKARMQKS